jgi:hypothetical protein
MGKYIAKRDTWLSHECRTVKANEEFETTFPNDQNGKPMHLSDNIEGVAEKKSAGKASPVDLV